MVRSMPSDGVHQTAASRVQVMPRMLVGWMTGEKQNANSGKRQSDAIVIGSGIGGLAAAAALAKRGRRVLDQHFQLKKVFAR
jgi:NADPH-dependent 2,4-dienoyl-CoA reductase/sulfur reductase-like enzyme